MKIEGFAGGGNLRLIETRVVFELISFIIGNYSTSD